MIDACNQNPCIHLSMALFYRWWSNDDKSCKQWRAEAKQETEQQKRRFNGNLRFTQYAGERER